MAASLPCWVKAGREPPRSGCRSGCRHVPGSTRPHDPGTRYRCRLGEIDLVARDGGTTVFVEVRRRASSPCGGAAASITTAKRLKLLKAARHYLSRLGTMPECRFDALLI